METDGNTSQAAPDNLGSDLLTGAKEIAAWLNWPRRRVYNAVEKRLIPCFKKGDLIMARKSELDAAFRAGAA
jgi:hypothetical protein